MPKRFTKVKEDFECLNCGLFVRGNGYTNHCPKCLWSRHVDVFPGDRSEGCLGLMKPVGIENRGGEYVILHKCQSCGAMRKNKAVKDDNFNVILAIASGKSGN